MPDNEREAFNTLALQDKQRYKRELEEYVQLKAQLKASMGSGLKALGVGSSLVMGPTAGQSGLAMRMGFGLNPGILSLPPGTTGTLQAHAAQQITQ